MASSLPSISIITPSYNQGQFLEAAIQSVLGQEYPDLEYIIIDGGSTDRSLEIILRYQSQLAYWVSEPDSGQSEAINKGLRKANGDLIAWLNSDDLFEARAFERVAACYAETRARQKLLISGAALLFDESGHTCEWIPRKISKGALLNHYRIADTPFSVMPCQPATFFTRGALSAVGGVDDNLHYAMDYDLWLRMLGNQVRIVYCRDILARYRFHAASKSSSSLGRFQEEWEAVSTKARRRSIGMAWSHLSWWILYRPRIRAVCLTPDELECLIGVAERRLGIRNALTEVSKAVLRNPFLLFNRMFLGAIKRFIVFSVGSADRNH
jgi:glycosyltransferase involved in cell wall biosynthesis